MTSPTDDPALSSALSSDGGATPIGATPIAGEPSDAGGSGPTGDESSDTARAGRVPEWVSHSGQILGLTGLAVAQPLFALLGENPTYFVAHRARPLDIVMFALAVVLIPALVLIVPVLLMRSISSTAGRFAAAAAIGLLATAVVLGTFDDGLGLWSFLALLVAGTAMGAWVYLRFRAARLFASYLSAAPLLFVALFLFTSGVQPLVFGDDDPAVLAAQRSQTPVVVLVFDELPLGALMRSDGTIDRERFPGFGELADTATWFPRATTVATYTFLAVPAILTGNLPKNAPPVAGQYPRSLFTALGGARQLHVSEQVTSLCPRSACGSELEDPAARNSLARDTAIVGLHQLLPEVLADRWLPSVSGSWTNFGDEVDQPPLPDDDRDIGWAEWRSRWEAGDTAITGFPAFLESLSNGGSGLWYQHEMLPHMHYRYLPDGRTYQGSPPRSWSSDNWWTDDPLSTVNAQQRLMLQLQYTDTRVSALLEQLREQGMLAESLVIVMSDHGIDMSPGRSGRGGDREGPEGPYSAAEAADVADAVLPIPLFVKFPGQTTGTVDERAARSIDVLPTVVDTLGLELPTDWTFDGRSLAGQPESDDALTWVKGADVVELASPPDPVNLAMRIEDLFGTYRTEHDLYAIGPHRDLVGQAVGAVGEPVPGARISSEDASALRDLEPDSGFVPALFTGDVSGIDAGSWIALALGDRIAGLGPVYEDFDGRAVVEIMIDPSMMDTGENELTVYLVGDDRLHPVEAG